jgi:tRNA G18 (ribose-2'-O)-methylase SpoU
MGETRAVLGRELSVEGRTASREQEESGKKVAVLLDNVRSAWNVGSILRSADGFGFTHAFLCGITPTADQEAVTKTALGAEEAVPWSYHKDAMRLVEGLKAEGWRVYALEDDPRAADLVHAADARKEGRAEVLIVGNEVTGVDPGLLNLCDHIFAIPMRGAKRSFNVAIAFSIAAWAVQIHG